MLLKVLVTGSSGLVGSALVSALRASGHDVKRLVRGTAAAPDQIPWNPTEPLAPQSVSGFDAVVHLAGESIAARWNQGKKHRITDSRVPPTRHLATLWLKPSNARESLSAPPPSATTAIEETKFCARTVHPGKDSPPNSAANGKRLRNLWPAPESATYRFVLASS